jgi:glycosyltransferase involved in cell wall biosynthesis
MRVAHLLRKLDPAEWSGTEVAVQRLVQGLRHHNVESVVFCPRLESGSEPDALARSGFQVHRFRAFVPVLGISQEQRRQLVAVGGNLMSLELLRALWRTRGLSLIHTHTLGRLGGIGLTVARRRRLPFVVTIHGGALDLPAKVGAAFRDARKSGWEWGKLFGVLFQSHRLFKDADALLTCNPREADLLKEEFPGKRIAVQPHAVPVEIYGQDQRAAARAAFPAIGNRQILLSLGRLDPVKNQGWLLEQAPLIFKKHPRALLVLAGPCTDEAYGKLLDERLRQAGLQDRVLLTGGMAAHEPRLIGLLQSADLLLLPSLSETFGLVILEAWAAGTTVLATRTSGPATLIEHGVNGWLFDLDRPQSFHETVDWALNNSARVKEMARRGASIAAQYGIESLARRMKGLYAELVEQKLCATSSYATTTQTH